MQKLRDNPAYGLLSNGAQGTETKDNRSYLERQGYGGMDRMQAAGAYQNSLTPEMIQQQVNNGQRSAGTNAQMQAMLANMPAEQRAAYIAKMQGLSPNLDPTYSGPVGSGMFGNQYPR